jgi:hypothetical protein
VRSKQTNEGRNQIKATVIININWQPKSMINQTQINLIYINYKFNFLQKAFGEFGKSILND